MAESEKARTEQPLIFTFFNQAYEVPADIDITVFRFDDGCVDFDFVADGKPVAMCGGVDVDGHHCPTWEDVGIRILGKVRDE